MRLVTGVSGGALSAFQKKTSRRRRGILSHHRRDRRRAARTRRLTTLARSCVVSTRTHWSRTRDFARRAAIRDIGGTFRRPKCPADRSIKSTACSVRDIRDIRDMPARAHAREREREMRPKGSGFFHPLARTRDRTMSPMSRMSRRYLFRSNSLVLRLFRPGHWRDIRDIAAPGRETPEVGRCWVGVDGGRQLCGSVEA